MAQDRMPWSLSYEQRYPSTGLDRLDEMLTHLRYGDNVVWQVDDISDYRKFVLSYVERAIQEGRKIVYIRFGAHEALLEPREGLTIIELDADVGFERFSSNVHRIVAELGRGVFYVFDSLSDLLSAWATDLMVGNFFCVTCPFLYELDTIAYFGILRDQHSFDTVARIRETTQLLLDLYRLEGSYFIHPLKVQNRYSPTMFLPHRDEGTRLEPVLNSMDAARLFAYISDKRRRQVPRKLDYWDRLFLRAEELSSTGAAPDEQAQAVEQICRIMLTREERMLNLIRRHFTLADLLEDSFGNAFAGKYESIFLVNQGSLEERYEQFEHAVRRIYAGAVGPDALSYRLQRGLDQLDEQMALLVQRVSGRYHGRRFYPDVGGVGVSYNTFVWNAQMNPQAGMLRIVLGLGTRAVDRVEHDYPRLVALDAPLVRPWSGTDNLRKFSQHYMDALNIQERTLETVPVKRVLAEDWGPAMTLLASRDTEAEARMSELGMDAGPAWILTFDALLSQTDFVATIQRLLHTLHEHYSYPVDIEFTVNFPSDRLPQINLLQCRPLQTRGAGVRVKMPAVEPSQIIFQAEGGFMGGNLSEPIQRVIYVDPAGYLDLPLQDKHALARLIGKINQAMRDGPRIITLLMGPGRWGTTTPTLGVPVRFSEINNMSVLCEMSYPQGNLMPELSYGSHFFQDLVETEIFYVALFEDRPGTVVRLDPILQLPNRLTAFAPEAEKYASVLRIIDTSRLGLQVAADVVSQRVMCFVGPQP